MHPLLALGTAALDIKTRLSRNPLPTTDVPGRITLKAGGVARNLAAVTLGNVLGGAGAVALVYHLAFGRP